jgi:hypothetical protein
MRTVSFNTLLTRFTAQSQVALNETTGLPNLSLQEEYRFTQYLNEAALWLWEQETHTMALPDMLTGKTVTLATGGLITAEDIEHSAFWSVWKSDPRLKEYGPERAALNLDAIGQANGDIKVTESNADATVYVIYKTIPPQWTVEAASSSCTYDIGDLVKCGTKVYRSLMTEASAGDVTDATVWSEVTLPQNLQRIIIKKANVERLRLGSSMPANAQSEEQELMKALDSAFLGAQPLTGIKDWLYNSNA